MQSETEKILVVIAQGQSRSPDKRTLEEEIAKAAATLPNTEALLVPHLYDLTYDSKSVETLRQWNGTIILLSWLFDRAAFWVLDRFDVRGKFGTVELKNPDFAPEEDGEDDEEEAVDGKAEDRVTSIHPRPDRVIYSIDMRSTSNLTDYVSELRRIVAQHAPATPSDAPVVTPLTLERLLNPTNSTALAADGSGTLDLTLGHSPLGLAATPMRVEDHPQRRWYPVIDYSRCTNCMECIDFCLFGVYGVDKGETILVEQPDNCRKGCPACSRVCPENAIIFPQHKTPAIAGAPVDGGGFKIDLSKLFGAPELNEDPAAAAARERDEQLMLAGRMPVAATATPVVNASAQVTTLADSGARESSASPTDRPKDNLDSLIDQLDELDL